MSSQHTAVYVPIFKKMYEEKNIIGDKENVNQNHNMIPISYPFYWHKLESVLSLGLRRPTMRCC